MKRTQLTGFFLLLITSPVLAETATTSIKATQDGATVLGQAFFEETPEGLKMTAEIQNLKPGKYGFHVHENGDCGDSGKAAGSHFNPDGAKHGRLTTDGFSGAHAGDLGNMEVGQDGTGKVEETLQGLTLGKGKYGVSGKAIILHEKEDDFSQPTGNAGGRIGCGIIEKIES